MRKILITGKLNTIIKNVYSYLDGVEGFKVLVCPEQKDVIEDIMEISEPDIVVLSLIGLSDANSELFDYFINKYPYLKVLCYGTLFEQETFKKYFAWSYYHVLTRPFSNKDLQNKIEKLLIESDQEKAAREEEKNAKMRKGVAAKTEEKNEPDVKGQSEAGTDKTTEVKVGETTKKGSLESSGGKTAETEENQDEKKKELERLQSEEAELLESLQKMKELEAKLQQVKKEKSDISRKKKILLVDDNAIQLRTLRSVLIQDYEVLLASSGQDALKVMQKNKPDLIFLDYEMLGMNGKEVMLRMLEIEAVKDIPVVFLTGEKDKERIMDVVKLNPAGYLLKPPDIKKIHDTIEEILG